jgi:hypothetical protein
VGIGTFYFGPTANGIAALLNNDTGSGSTAIGAAALEYSTATGTAANTAVGYQALQGNVNMSLDVGTENSALGYQALQNNTSGTANTATGYQALSQNTSGEQNTASGSSALQSNTSGNSNVAVGQGALADNTSGASNVAVGQGALANTTTGTNNIAIGYSAGSSIGTSSCPGGIPCSYNIDIGNNGVAFDVATIRIGSIQNSTYIAGINAFDLGSSGSPVVIDAYGHLGINTSSRRYKENIQSMGDASRGLMDLRPVTFHYKKPAADGSKPLQYGLIAEEVADVYPDLVVYKDGQPNAVQYQLLPSMLLNEVQRQQAEIQRLEERLARLEAILTTVSAASAVPGPR